MAVDAGRRDVPDTKINVEAEDREAEEEKEDPLVKAKREQEELEQALEAARDVNPNDDPAMKVCGRVNVMIYNTVIF
jgi:hypothetical protein